MIFSTGKTMVQGRNYGPHVTVRRLAMRGKKTAPIFNQISHQVQHLLSFNMFKISARDLYSISELRRKERLTFNCLKKPVKS